MLDRKQFFPIALLALLAACSGEKTELLVDRWRMEDENITVEFRPDSTFSFFERGQVLTGRWQLNPDKDAVLLTQEDRAASTMKIKRLDENSLVLIEPNEGFEMKFRRSPTPERAVIEPSVVAD